MLLEHKATDFSKSFCCMRGICCETVSVFAGHCVPLVVNKCKVHEHDREMFQYTVNALFPVESIRMTRVAVSFVSSL